MDEQEVKVDELRSIFEFVNMSFLRDNYCLFEKKASELTYTGAFMQEMHDILMSTQFGDYFVDLDYHINTKGKVRCTFRRYLDEGARVEVTEEIVKPNTDLIVHGRGKNLRDDRLIVMELETTEAPKLRRQQDRMRLMCLTRTPGQGVCEYSDGLKPEDVCGCLLGIYYEINYRKWSVDVEYYIGGVMADTCHFKIRRIDKAVLKNE